MDDAALVAAARRGDHDAWGTVYDRYADRLHDHCWSILRDEHEAADALHDAFVNAARALPQLRDPARLRPWLYAIARNEAFRRHRARGRAVPMGDLAAELGDDDDGLGTVTVDFDDAHGSPVEDLRRLVWDAAGGLSASDQALLDLHLRQGLEGEELAEAMGINANNAYVRMSRLRDTLERSLGALLVARTGRQDCGDLAAILEGWGGELTPLLRKRVARHIDSCEQCGERRRTMVSPLALFAGMPLLPAPDGLRERVISAAAAAAAQTPLTPDELFPAPVAAAAAVVPAPPPEPPEPRDPAPAGDEADGPPWGWILGALAALVLLAVVALLVISGGGSGDDDTTTTSSTTTSTSTTSTSTTSTSTTSTSTTSTSTTQPPAPGAIGLSTSSLDFGGSDTSRQVSITNTGGTTISYTVTTTASTAVLDLNRTGGTLAPGASHTLQVTLVRTAAREGDFAANIRINAGAAGQPLIGVTARIAHPPEIESVTLDPDGWFFPPTCPTTQVVVAFSDESDVRGTLFWETSDGPGNRPLELDGDLLVATLDPPAGPSQALTYWVVLVDELGTSSGESPHQTVTATAPCP